MVNPQALNEGRCPRCGKRFRYAAIAAHKPFPFCSDRCRDVDLGNWLTEKSAIPGAPADPTPPRSNERRARRT
jgi:hypothetical protein